MAEYCTVDDVLIRASRRGMDVLQNPDEQIELLIESGIEDAGFQVDTYINRVTSTEVARASGNAHLMRACRDLAILWVVTTSGASPQEEVLLAAEEAKSLLQDVADRRRDIGLLRPTNLKSTFKNSRYVHNE